MATKIPTEIVIKILNNVQSTQDLHSSLLVNRTWCKITIPILWELPFGQECCMDDKKLRKKALCIRTYLSCMDTQARNLLIQNGFDLSSSSPQATFDYPSFTHKFFINNLVYFISIYSQHIFGSERDYNNNNNNDKITITKILFREICKLIINRCSFLDHFMLRNIREDFSQNFRNYSDLINSILKLPGAKKVFKKLESFTSMIKDEELIHPLLESLTLICDNILDMDLFLYSNFLAQLSAKLISSQKRLENLSIGVCGFLDYNLIFGAIISQKEILKSLHLTTLDFGQYKVKLIPNGQFISLQELYIKDCSGLHKSDCLSLASSFTQLSSFHFSDRSNIRNSQEFIMKILETANINLKNICLYLYPAITSDIFSAILNYCTKITKLTLEELSLEQVIAVFNNNFNELRSFSFYCAEGIDANDFLGQMAENVPESLESIEIVTGIFRADSLRRFFEGWNCKGRNKKMFVSCTEQAPTFTLSDEHFKVIEEYGVQFELYSI